MNLVTTPHARAAALSAIFFGCPLATAEDLTITYKMTTQGSERTATHYYSAKFVRFDLGEDDSVVDLAQGRVFNISHKRREYSESTIAEIEEAGTRMSAHMEKAMEGIPESLRLKMSGDAAKEVTVTKGETRVIAGLSCQDYTVALGEKTRMRSCVTNDIETPFDAKQLKNLAPLMVPLAVGSSALSRMLRKVRDLPGLSLASSTSVLGLGKPVEMTFEATAIKKGPIERATFDIPAGYRKIDSPFAKLPH